MWLVAHGLQSARNASLFFDTDVTFVYTSMNKPLEPVAALQVFYRILKFSLETPISVVLTFVSLKGKNFDRATCGGRGAETLVNR